MTSWNLVIQSETMKLADLQINAVTIKLHLQVIFPLKTK